MCSKRFSATTAYSIIQTEQRTDDTQQETNHGTWKDMEHNRFKMLYKIEGTLISTIHFFTYLTNWSPRKSMY